MSFIVETLPDLPAVMFVQTCGQFILELDDILLRLNAVLDEQPEPVFLILDVRSVPLSLDDLTSASSAVMRGPGALLHHPNVRDNVMVTTDGMLKLAAKGLGSPAYGRLSLRVVETPEMALAYCREQISRSGNGSARAS